MTLLIDGPTALFGGLIDYAGIFPPALLALDDAAVEYRSARRGEHAWMLGRFLATTSRLEDLAGVLTRSMTTGEAPWPVGAIVDEAPGVGALHAQVFERHMSPAVRVETVEARLPQEASDGRTEAAAAAIVRPFAEALISISAEVVPYLEVARGDNWQTGMTNAVAAVASVRSGLLRTIGAKLRTGGTEPAAFPSPEQVARFIVACRDNGLSYKATAGLHHPIRHRDDELQVMRHGFLNLLVAGAVAKAGGSEKEIIAAIREENADVFNVSAGGLRFADVRFAIPVIRSMRATLFPAYGSCSFVEPVDDLAAMGLLS